MKKYTVMIIALFIFLFSFNTVFGGETTTKVGEWENYSGSINFSVVEKDGKKYAQIFIHDAHLIESNYFAVGKSSLEEIRALIDQTIQELEE
jgi:hypothetical protein